VEARQAAYREVVSKVASRIASPRLKIVDPMEALCDKASCYAMKDGILLYRDTNHLSMDGARYVWSRLKGRGY
jgi:hypothetical protein